ncbi:MAG: hypothetical protein LW860_15405 [Xanthomonadaceae bacterium]|jgi:hypothetical protein|nr:hypothetical protein [Xanthomonadaceae bacterium]
MDGPNAPPPSVVRYAERRYIERFFQTGELRLAPLRAFGANAVAEPKRDRQEGWGHVAFERGAGRVAGTFTPPGQVLVLCCSLEDSREQADRLVGPEGAGIRITNIERFMRKVAVSLDGCVRWEHRACDYSGRVRSTPVFGLDQAMAEFDEAHGKDPSAAMHGLWDFMVGGHFGREWIFMKDPGHAHEQEYRLVWYFDRPVREPIITEFPHARRACVPAWL